jgi:hypothetical protein
MLAVLADGGCMHGDGANSSDLIYLLYLMSLIACFEP